MPTGDLSDILTGDNTLHNCLYNRCGRDCPEANPTLARKYGSKTIDQVVKNYRACHAPGITLSANAEKYFTSDMSAAYVAYINTIQDVGSRSSNPNALSDDIKTARRQLDQDLADIYKLDTGKLS